jgi:phospholipase/lecithinase/hemolysin
MHSRGIVFTKFIWNYLQQFYSMGFRKMLVSGIGPIGCIPHELARAKTPDCIQTTNEMALNFNGQLRSLLDQLTGQLINTTFLYGNTYDTVTGLITNPAARGTNSITSLSIFSSNEHLISPHYDVELVSMSRYYVDTKLTSKLGRFLTMNCVAMICADFQVVNEGCCGSGLYRGQFPCWPAAELCYNRDQYVFWDLYHTTEAVNILVADGLYAGGPDQISPMNLYQLMDLP